MWRSHKGAVLIFPRFFSTTYFGDLDLFDEQNLGPWVETRSFGVVLVVGFQEVSLPLVFGIFLLSLTVKEDRSAILNFSAAGV